VLTSALGPDIIWRNEIQRVTVYVDLPGDAPAAEKKMTNEENDGEENDNEKRERRSSPPSARKASSLSNGRLFYYQAGVITGVLDCLHNLLRYGKNDLACESEFELRNEEDRVALPASSRIAVGLDARFGLDPQKGCRKLMKE